jgi:hypothetical protein
MDRRTLLQSGALAIGSLALGGVWSHPAGAAVPAAATPGVGPLAGPVLAWMIYDPDREGVVRVFELVDGQPARLLAAASIPLLPLATASLRAQELAVRVVAGAWSLPQGACEVRPGCIATTGRTVDFRLWVDFA